MSSGYRREGRAATDTLGTRRSCCECGRQKKKCDGRMPCSRCFRAGVQCIYVKRKSTHPQYERKQQLRGPTGTLSTDLLHHSSSGALLPLKRFRLSASPATGLVGMQENAFLSDFFGCVSFFLPLTTPSHVRETMVRMMALSAAQHQLGAPHDPPDQGQFGVFTDDGFTTGSQLLTGPSACTFWCAVGVGALVKGSPVESVASYSRLARDALDAYTGTVNAQVAKAWAILGYFYGFMGDTAKFEEYLGLSGSFLTASIEQESTDMLPAGFAEMVHYKQTVKAYSGNADATDIESLAARRQRPPQINPAVSEGDVYLYVAQSFAALEQVAFEKACRKSATREQMSDGEPCLEKEGCISPRGNAPQVEEVSDAIAAGLKDGLVDFGQLQEAVDRPNFRKGIGGLAINMTLAYQKAASGDACGTLERLGHCVEVFERYPGVCRCMPQWSHLAHSVLGGLAAIDDSRARGLYKRLRDVYNRFRPSSSLRAPPLEEWRGISALCDHFQCRINEGVIGSQAMSVFSTPPHCTSNCTGSQPECEQDDSQVGHEEHHNSSIGSVGAVPENATGATMGAPCSTGDKPKASTSSWELNQASSPRTGPPDGPSVSASHLHSEFARGGASDTDFHSGAVVGCSGVDSGLVGQVPGISATSPLLGDVDGGSEMWDDPIAAADWLDVTHGMLDERTT